MSDPQLFVTPEGYLLSAHVDDVLIAAPPDGLEKILEILRHEFKIKVGPPILDEWTPFLGRQWRRVGDHALQVRIKPQHYHETVALAGLAGCKSASTPDTKITMPGADEYITPSEHKLFRSLVGRLYSNVDVRVEMQSAIREVARASAGPTIGDMTMLKHIVRYVEGTSDYILTLQCDENVLENQILTHVDAAWGSSRGRRSVSGGTMRVSGVLAASWSRTQKVICHSSCEAELVALHEGIVESKRLKSMMIEIGIPDVSIILITDSAASIRVAMRRGLGKLKHLELKYISLQEDLRAGEIQLQFIPGLENEADIFTKPLAVASFCKHRAGLGVRAGDSDDGEAPTTSSRTPRGMLVAAIWAMSATSASSTNESVTTDENTDELDDDYTFPAVMITMFILSLTTLWQLAQRLWKCRKKAAVSHHLKRPKGHGRHAVKSARDAGKAAYHSWKE